MAHPVADDTIFDTDLDAQFSHLSMSPQHSFDPMTHNVNDTSLWSDPVAGFSTQPFDPSQQEPSLNTLPVPTTVPQDTFQQQYPEDTAYDLYWSPDPGSAQAGSSSAPMSGKAFQCPYEDCDREYDRQCDLDKHMNNHTKRRKCDLCPEGKAETKDLNRHMWAKHPNEARARGLPKEEDRCAKCGYAGRKDNVKRHKDKKNHW